MTTRDLGPGKQMLRTKCAACDWIYDVVVLPLEAMRTVAVMQGAHCPMCGNIKGNTVAEPRGLTADEAAHPRLVGKP